ncbi:MAG: porin family protein [Chitinophagaceae bacterium]
MKKLNLTLIGLFAAITVFSQAEFGAFAGPQITYASYFTPEINLGKTKQKTEMKYGFQAGGMMRVQFEGRFFFAPMVFYSLKGYKVTLTRPSLPPDSLATDNNTTIHTIEFAPLFQFNFSDAPAHLFIKAGPSIDLQLFGKERFNKSNSTAVDRNMKFSFDSDYGRFGANLLLQFGYETSSGFVISGQYTLGFGSIVNEEGGASIYHRTAGITFGKYFRRN